MDVTRSESDMSRSSHDVRSDDGRGPISESSKSRMVTTDLPGYGRDICDHIKIHYAAPALPPTKPLNLDGGFCAAGPLFVSAWRALGSSPKRSPQLIMTAD